MRKISIIIFFIVNILSANASEIKLYGNISDTKGAGLPYVNVKAEVMGTDRVGHAVSDANGYYELTFDSPGDSCRVVYSCIGFKTYSCILPFNKSSRKNVKLEDDTNLLNEIKVTGALSIQQADKTIFLPTTTQRKSSNTGWELLHNMMIPELYVDKNSGKVKTTSDKDVTVCINGQPASDIEVKALRSRDIVRVDYHPNPTGKWATYQSVIDFIVRTVDDGGYLSINTSTKFITPHGDYNVYGKWRHNKWESFLYGSTTFDNDRHSGSDMEETVSLSPSFVKYTSNEDYHRKDMTANGTYFLRYNGPHLVMKADAGLNWNHTPVNTSHNDISYADNVYSPSLAAVSQTEKGISPNVNVYMQAIMDNQTLSCSVGYKYVDCKYPSLNFTLAYNMDYGHKKLEKDDSENIDKTINYGILHAE